MADFEQKLRNCYECDPIEIREGFLEDLKALEASREVPQKRRRRYALPIAAAIAALLFFVVGLAWLRASRPDKSAEPDTVQKEAGQSLMADDQPAHPAPKDPVPPAQKPSVAPSGLKTEEPAAQQTDGSDGQDVDKTENKTTSIRPSQAPMQQSDSADIKTGEPDAQTTGAQEEPEPEAQEELKPEAQEEPKPNEPDGERPDGTDVPQTETPDEPKTDEPYDPGPSDPPPADEPPADEPPATPEIGATYRMSGGRETLTLTLLSTGESVEVDVTGWADQSESSPDAPPSPAAYSGRNPIVNYIFEKDITYHLTRDDDGAVRVDLDVANTDN